MSQKKKGHTAALKETSTQTEAYKEKPSQRTLEEADVYIENVLRKEVAVQTALLTFAQTDVVEAPTVALAADIENVPKAPLDTCHSAGLTGADLDAVAVPTAQLEDLEMQRLNDDIETETLDEILWPLLPFYGERAATMQPGGRACGTITAVVQTVAVPHVLLYVPEFDDGDLEHLGAGQAAKATSLALARAPTADPPLRTLRRRDAVAHAAKEAASGSRTLSRLDAGANSLSESQFFLKVNAKREEMRKTLAAATQRAAEAAQEPTPRKPKGPTPEAKAVSASEQPQPKTPEPFLTQSEAEEELREYGTPSPEPGRTAPQDSAATQPSLGSYSAECPQLSKASSPTRVGTLRVLQRSAPDVDPPAKRQLKAGPSDR